MSFQVSPKDYSVVSSGGCLTFEHNTAMIEKTMESLKKASDTGKAIKNAFKENGDKFVSGAINPNNSIASKIVKLNSKIFNPNNSIASKIAKQGSLGDKFVKLNSKVINPDKSIVSKMLNGLSKIFKQE